MKKTFITKLSGLVVILLCFAMIAPFCSLQTLAADESSEVDIWEILKPAYLSTGFTNIEDRIRGNGTIEAMTLEYIDMGYAIYSDRMTGEIVILQLEEPNASGNYTTNDYGIYNYIAYFTTNPYNIGSSVTVPSGHNTADSSKKNLYSQIVLTYEDNGTSKQFYSFEDSALYDQIDFKRIKSGVRVEYTLGRENETYLIPRWIRYDKFEDLLVQIKANTLVERDLTRFQAFYQYIDPTAPGLAEKTKDELLVKYQCTSEFPIYVCESVMAEKELLLLERIITSYTNYSEEQMNEDHEETGYESTDEIPALFKLALEYTIDEYGFKVNCNAGNIRYDNEHYTLKEIQLLPYAGAGNVNNDGYILTPDGSGSITSFSDIAGINFKTTNAIYGQDHAMYNVSGANKETFTMPVYGCVETVKGHSKTTEEVEIYDEETGEMVIETVEVLHDLNIGYLAVIESGESLANICVENGGSVHMFATVYTAFNPRPSDTFKLTSGLSAGQNAMWTVESKRKYTEDYTIRYFMLSGDGINYSEMADIYRKYLIRKGDLTELSPETEDSDDIALYIETWGAIIDTKEVLGIPVSATTSLTSFEDDITILNNLSNNEIYNINNIRMILNGWNGEGMITTAPLESKPVKELGGEEGLKNLFSKAEELGAVVYPDFDLTFIEWKKSFDGVKAKTDVIKSIDERYASFKEWHNVALSYYYADNWLISPNVYERYYRTAYEDYKRFNNSAISVQGFGEYLFSDFNTKQPLNREDSKTIVKNLLAQIAEQNEKVLVSRGNAYSYKYATDIINLPLDDSRYKNTSAAVPFVSMVLHGCVEYSGTAYNLAGDESYIFLKTLENGASPYFVVAYENTESLIYYYTGNLNKYYSIRYQVWEKDIIKTYNDLNAELKKVKYSQIIKHEYVDTKYNVVRVEYDNGTVFYLNYSVNDYTVEFSDGTSFLIKAGSYLANPVAS